MQSILEKHTGQEKFVFCNFMQTLTGKSLLEHLQAKPKA
jgi:hypothetical protein